ncbi:MAG: slipin family protein [Bacteroidetes bacterium]|nr:slipin family protein [Bacteroidota bacterium]
MLRLVNTPKGVISILFRNGRPNQILTEGENWSLKSGSLYQYQLGAKVSLPTTVSLRANLDVLGQYLEVIDLKQSEIAIVLRNGVFEDLLVAGLHAYWKSEDTLELKAYNTQALELAADIDASLRAILSARGFVRVFKVDQGEKALLLKDAKLFKVLEPGEYFYWNNQISLKLLKANMQKRSLELNGQEMLTKDKASLRINLIALMRVVNIEKALMENSNYEQQAYLSLSLALRAYVSELSLDELLSRKVELAEKIANTVVQKFNTMGLELVDVGLRDIILPGEMREIMNAVLYAEKQAQANLVTRREETASTRSLMNTAKLMENNPMLWKLKEMEYLEKVVSKVGTVNISGGELGSKLRELFSSA